MASRRATASKSALRHSKQFSFWLDEPASWERKVRRLRLSGWCVGRDGRVPASIRAILRLRVFTSGFDRDRPDVVQNLGLTSDSLRCGFTLEVRVPFGRNKLLLEVVDAQGKTHSVFARQVVGPLMISAEERELEQQAAEAEARSRFAFSIDRPADWQPPADQSAADSADFASTPRRAQPTLGRQIQLLGWCLSPAGKEIVQLRARIGKQVFPMKYGLVRPDVAAAFESHPTALQSGFAGDLLLPRIGARLVLEAQNGAGEWEQFFTRWVRGPLLSARASTEEETVGNYAEWIRRYDKVTRRDRQQILQHIERFPRRPLISIVLPVYNPEPDHLRRALRSVRAQLYPHWQLCLADDASTTPEVRSILTRFARMDRRIRLHFREANGGISAASNDALDLATGEFVALLDHDDELTPTALYFVAHEINRSPEAQLIYSDEDKLDLAGHRTNPHFKSDWNHTLLLSQNYFSHLGTYRSELIKRLRFRAGFEGSQDYDLVLRASEEVDPGQIRHIPRVLYHWRMAPASAALNIQLKPKARSASIKAVEEHLARTKIAARVERTEFDDFQRIRYELPAAKPKVSLIIPTRDLLEYLRPCLESILSLTSYPNYEIVVVDNGSRHPDILAYLVEMERRAGVRLLRLDEEFNYARLNNLGVKASEAEFVVLLNNDLTVLTPDWLEEMVGQAIQPGVGAVGARLLFPDGHIQHAGVILGAGGGGLADHAHKGLPKSNHGYFSRAMLAQELSAVTAACMLVRRSIYLEAGGFDEEHLKIGFNDVDFCLRLRARGYRIIYTPYAELRHWESASRGLEETREKQERFWREVNFAKSKWAQALAADPFYNPNLTLNDQLFTLAFPPRVENPWSTE